MANKIERTEIVDNEEEVVQALARFIVDKSKKAIAERNRFVIGLSGAILYSQPEDTC